ncbi:MAG: hypothetical protein JWM31_2577 [Solirubrobacterales bacterium]|nr:hypothetical protein [Solirubrobacterales bacterium]
MRLRTTALIPLTIAAFSVATPAHAGFFGAEAIDGGAGIASVGDLDLARDGNGAVAYVKDDGGTDHVFVSRLVSGVFQPPERVDGGLPGAGSAPVVAVTDGGRVVVAYVNGGTVYTSVRPAGVPTFSIPQAIATGASAPSVDMSINGVAYVSYTAAGASAADVRVARLERNTSTFNVLPDTLDINPAADAGTAGATSDIAVSADGTAVVVWGEGGRVWGRRIFENRISVAPQDLTVDTLAGHAGNTGSATDPHIDIEDDSSFAWVTFRQSFDDNVSHTIARRLVGSEFEAPVQVDGIGFGGDGAASSSVQMNGRGEGLATTGTTAKNSFVSVLHDDTFFPAAQINPANNVAPHPTGDLAENNDGYVAWMQGATPLTATVQGVFYDVALDKRTVPAPGPASELSNPDFGPVDVSGGLDLAVDRVGDAVAVFVQGVGSGRKLVYGGFDRTPGILSTSTTQRFRNIARPQLAWSAAFDLWGPVTYTAEIDGVVVGQSQATRLPLLAPLADGVHTWKVTATDRRGQTNVSRPGLLKVDTTAPSLSFSVAGVRQPGRAQTVKVTTADPPAGTVAGSGVRRVAVSFGDGATSSKRTATHAYGKGGTFTVRVSSTDNAGNVTVVRKAITLKSGKRSAKKKQ